MSQETSYCNITQCEIPIRVPYRDVDRQNAVHHSQYAVYFEMGRTELLRINGHDYKTLEDNGLFLVVVRLQCRFRHPARYDDELLLTTSLAKADRVRLEHHYSLQRPVDNTLIAEGQTVLVHVDHNGALQPLPRLLVPGCWEHGR